ncbi:hypothetical protein [Niabella aurantiaca]|uniref:hypothetical protein n=1 Tax=Niabella aurantiaca TaxID=379900 RepID=UPI0003754B3B|nr:hypothetical protein [Niabella aurantiaca]
MKPFFVKSIRISRSAAEIFLEQPYITGRLLVRTDQGRTPPFNPVFPADKKLFKNDPGASVSSQKGYGFFIAATWGFAVAAICKKRGSTTILAKEAWPRKIRQERVSIRL